MTEVNFRTVNMVINPSLSKKEIGSALLDDIEYSACLHERIKVRILDSAIAFTSPKILANLLKISRKDALNNGDIKIEKVEYFHWHQATQGICKTFGLANFGIIGTRNKVKGISVTVAPPVGNDEFLSKLAQIKKKLKTKFPKHGILADLESCQMIVSCTMLSNEETEEEAK